MKVVDMQAAGLPVLAFKYDSIYELIQPGFNGDLFENEGELSDLIYEMIRNPDKV
eukprot:CAMPEP_0168313726 /NCGR_PEP_ID=MMETSP0210-20121227/3870_1 /TAXON_ID=40633 /ORGANISM="Condylostoma magnum, Strain COL2" /LENGTH=54 /DNA_ID=CAMNT_0008273853 /DNA_START=904 /DNA_END=1068 /DNA_ORIENTATION=-